MIIKILGTGCSKCNKLENNTREAVESLGLEVDIEKITDFKEIVKYGVLQTPALVVDDIVKTYGSLPSTKEIINLLK